MTKASGGALASSSTTHRYAKAVLTRIRKRYRAKAHSPYHSPAQPPAQGVSPPYYISGPEMREADKAWLLALEISIADMQFGESVAVSFCRGMD